MNYLNITLFFILSSQLLMASDVTINQKKFEDKFCKEFKTQEEQGTFCMSSEIKYPVVKSKDRILKKNLEEAIKKHLGKLEKGASKKYILDAIKEEFASSTEHEEHKIIDILSVTPKTFTLEISNYGYSGGAHGHSNIALKNYDRATGKELKIDNFFIKNYKNRLTKIIEKEYRRQEHVTARENLEDKLYWFKNRFVLSENIGIGKDGLHLEYNPYEIKPYAGGTTSLIVRYELLKDIIRPNGFLSSFIKESKLSRNSSKEYTFLDKLITFNVKVKRISIDKIEINLVAKNSEFDISKGGVSLSFPQLKDKSEIINKSSRGFNKLLVYPQNSPIYNFKSKKSKKSDYLLVEGEAKKWKSGGEKRIKLEVKIPKESKVFDINLRATVIKNKKILQTPFSGEKGQQGVSNYIIKVDL